MKDITQAKSAEITKIATEPFQEYIRNMMPKTGNDVIDKIISEMNAKDIIKRGAAVMQLLQNSMEVRVGLDAIFVSCITGTWTAFETMAGDLWEAALNAHPDRLANLKGRNRCKAQYNDNEAMQPRYSVDSKQLSLDAIAKHGWSTDRMMGTILKQRYSFATLYGIRTAYSEAFSKNYNNIDEVICSELLDALSVLRNVIVHKSSIADQEYVVRSARISRLPHAVVGEKIAIDGNFVASIIDGTFCLSMSLLEAVDKWIAKE